MELLEYLSCLSLQQHYADIYFAHFQTLPQHLSLKTDKEKHLNCSSPVFNGLVLEFFPVLIVRKRISIDILRPLQLSWSHSSLADLIKSGFIYISLIPCDSLACTPQLV